MDNQWIEAVYIEASNRVYAYRVGKAPSNSSFQHVLDFNRIRAEFKFNGYGDYYIEEGIDFWSIYAKEGGHAIQCVHDESEFVGSGADAKLNNDIRAFNQCLLTLGLTERIPDRPVRYIKTDTPASHPPKAKADKWIQAIWLPRCELLTLHQYGEPLALHDYGAQNLSPILPGRGATRLGFLCLDARDTQRSPVNREQRWINMYDLLFGNTKTFTFGVSGNAKLDIESTKKHIAAVNHWLRTMEDSNYPGPVQKKKHANEFIEFY